MIRSIFCDHLEYQIGAMLENLSFAETKGFWCDGVVPPDIGEIVTSGNNTILLRIFIGKTGQTGYLLQAKLGTDFIKRTEGNLNDVANFPVAGKISFRSIDVTKKTLSIEIHS